MQVVKLWQFVHPASIQKTWNFEVEQVSRSHSATLMKCLRHYVAFVNKDPRLVLFSEPGNAIGILNVPVHKFDTGDIVPVGSLDNWGSSKYAQQNWLVPSVGGKDEGTIPRGSNPGVTQQR